MSYKHFASFTVSGAATDSYDIVATTAGSTATVSGAEAKYEISIGLDNTVGGKGYSTGGYSQGYYSLLSSDTDLRARIWQFSNIVNDLLANTRKNSLYRWQRNTSVRAALVGATDIPTDITTHFVTPERRWPLTRPW